MTFKKDMYHNFIIGCAETVAEIDLDFTLRGHAQGGHVWTMVVVQWLRTKKKPQMSINALLRCRPKIGT